MFIEKYQRGTHSVPEIDRVAFGVSLFKTMLETADEKTRNYLGYSTSDIKTLMSEPFTLGAEKFNGATMRYYYSNNDPLYKKLTYDAAEISHLSSYTDGQKKLVALIAHEADHMLNLPNDTKTKYSAAVSAMIIGAAATGYGVIAQDMSFAMAGSLSCIASAIGADTYGRVVNYNAELQAYTQQARVEYYLGNHASSKASLIKHQIEQTKPKIKTLKEMFVANYPSPEKRDLITLETNLEALQTRAPSIDAQAYHELQRIALERQPKHNIYVIYS